jgi:hypothetical protein
MEEHGNFIFKVEEQANQLGSKQRDKRRYIPEDRNLHDHRCENLKTLQVERRLKFEHSPSCM